ncbi:MAG: DEAD/DEAH box helicase [Spirochaetes bacterium]|nr:DEAD/DEAH box helicase [Spirochaetota bacterium]
MSSLQSFHPLVLQWFTERIGTPTDVQERSWEAVARGEHILMTAPTGSGKTLAAFLTAVNSLITKPREGAYRILYISPLKALNNDIRRNLETPIDEIRGYFSRSGEAFRDISVGVRSGDTSSEERRRMQRRPPDIFITTPESLSILLTSAGGEPLVSSIGTVILDEIHAVAGTKRGAFLMTAIERLTVLNGEFRRIAVSATVNPLPRIADIIGGYRHVGTGVETGYEKRRVSIIRSDIEKRYDISVSFPDLGEDTSRDDWWLALSKTFRAIITRNSSTLLFANSRRMVEKITRFLNESTDAPDVYSHHGSLSREIRSVVEERFKKGELAAVVATSSLELGIDIGDVSEVILVEPPFSVSAAIQRIGRAGHAVGSVSRSTFYALHAHDLISAAVLAAHTSSEFIEEIIPPVCPLDVLAQVILSMTVNRTRTVTEVFDEVRTSWYYHTLTRSDFDLVIEMLAGRYADSRIRELSPRIILDKTNGTLRARDGTAMLIYLSGGVIPDRGYYTMREAGTKAVIGELDEEFVWERSLGDVFPFGNRLWRIIRISHNDVDVVPVGDKASALPFWKADSVSRPFAFSEKIGSFLEYAETHIHDAAFRASLSTRYHMNDHAAESLIAYLLLQRAKTNAPLPHRHHLLIEHCSDPNNMRDTKQVILHTLWGLAVNRPFAFALAAAWEKKHGYPLVFFAGNDAIMLELPHEFSAADVLSLVTPENAAKLIREKLESHEFFGGHFRENAQRALLLPRNFKKRMPLWLNRLRSKKLLEATAKYDDFPVILETWRSCLRDESDLAALDTVLTGLADGSIAVTETITSAPSPFAGDVAWRQTNTYMYEDDTPLSKFHSNLRGDLIKNIFSAGTFPTFTDELLSRYESKRKRIAPGYSPDSIDELFLWVKERRFIPLTEWADLLAAITRDHGITFEDSELSKSIIISNGVYAREDETSMAAIFGTTAPVDGDAGEMRAQFISEFLRFYSPMPSDRLSSLLPIDTALTQAAVTALLENGDIITGQFHGPDCITEICEAGTLETLLRLRRTEDRAVVTAKPVTALPAFLARRQGVGISGASTQDLERCMERLFGFSAKASFWESEIFPARLTPYYTAWLDTVLGESDCIWFGTGKERISFCFATDHELFATSSPVKSTLADFFAGKNGRYTLADILKETGLDSSTTAASLWELAFHGHITNDDFKSIRLGVQNGFAADTPPAADHKTHQRIGGRSGFNRWKTSRPFTGAWYSLPGKDERDPLEEQELIKDRARMVLSRYGIVFRELLAHELPMLRWKSLFTAFRLMELSGEIVSGRFFDDVLGLQFASPDALKDFTADAGDNVWWINAADPASAAGIDIPQLKSQLPERLASTHIVYRGETIVLVSRRNGKEVTVYASADDTRFQEYCGVFRTLVSREFEPLSVVRIETINDAPAVTSDYSRAFTAAGFQSDGKSLVLVKRY